MEAITEQDDQYAEFLSILQQKNKLTDNELNKARRMQRSAINELFRSY